MNAQVADDVPPTTRRRSLVNFIRRKSEVFRRKSYKSVEVTTGSTISDSQTTSSPYNLEVEIQPKISIEGASDLDSSLGSTSKSIPKATENPSSEPSPRAIDSTLESSCAQETELEPGIETKIESNQEPETEIESESQSDSLCKNTPSFENTLASTVPSDDHIELTLSL